jgi:hypothetical protein
MNNINLIESTIKSNINLHNFNNHKYNNISTQENLSLSLSLSTYIYNNFNSLSDIELKQLYCKIISPKEMKSRLCLYELEHNNNKNINIKNFQDFATQSLILLNKYTRECFSIITLEDPKWVLNQEDKEDNIITFKNSILACDQVDHNTNVFIINIVNRLNIINIDLNLKIETTFSDKLDVKNNIINLIITSKQII